MKRASIQELMNLQDQVCLVTGGAGHIGSTLCDCLSQLGGHVIVVDREANSCKRVASELPGPATGLVANLQERVELESLVETVVKRHARLDVLVNCAAFVGTSGRTGWAVPFREQSLEAWNDALHLNLTVPFALSQRLAPTLAKYGGRIINISSIYGSLGPDMSLYDGTKMQNPAAYGASKGGLVQLTRYLSTVLAPQIRVNAISPGGIERGQPESFQRKYAERTPLQRMGREEDLAGACAYLATELSAYVTGQNIMVDGGWSAW